MLEPRRKKRTIYAITFGNNHRIKFWELKSAFTQTLKLWEKNLEDFLKAPGASSIKSKLLFESSEYSNLKWNDVHPKV